MDSIGLLINGAASSGKTTLMNTIYGHNVSSYSTEDEGVSVTFNTTIGEVIVDMFTHPYKMPDVILDIRDSSGIISQLSPELTNIPIITVWNKVDIEPYLHPTDGHNVEVSAKSGYGFDVLISKIMSLAFPNTNVVVDITSLPWIKREKIETRIAEIDFSISTHLREIEILKAEKKNLIQMS